MQQSKEKELVVKQLQYQAEMRVEEVREQYEARFQDFRRSVMFEQSHNSGMKLSGLVAHTPHSGASDVNKNIEQLRKEISAQKTKLSRMKLNFE